MGVRAQNFYELETPKNHKHQAPKENLRKWQVFWTQHQVFNEPKAPRITWT